MFKTRCAITGTFDPVTKAHDRLVQSAKNDFDIVYVALLINENKTPLFSTEERLEILKKLYANDPKVIVEFYDGFAVDFCKMRGINVLIRGFRGAKDFNYEKVMAEYNRKHGGVMTLLKPDEDNYLSSSIVREALILDDDISEYVPVKVEGFIRKLYKMKTGG